MKKTFTTAILALFLTLICWAQEATTPTIEYDMTFVGRGEASTVGSVTVENLTRGTTLDLQGSDILRLTNKSLSGLEEVEFTTMSKPLIFPNPSFGPANVVFAPSTAGKLTISVTDVSGKTLLSNSFDVLPGKQTAILPSLHSGIYVVTIRGAGISESIKWTSLGGGSSNNPIRLAGETSLNLFTTKIPKAKVSKENVVEMEFEKGELLRFTGKSGDMTTIVMNQPTLSHPITFDFHKCTDAAGRHYPIVNVGGILWMAEDLGVVPAKAALRKSVGEWSDFSAAKTAYRNFDANSTDKGGYYNWAGAKAAIPVGWELPTAGEVDYMLQRLGMTAIKDSKTTLITGYENHRANLLKSRDDSWASSVGAIGPDTTSFGAKSTGVLSTSGTFSATDYKVSYWTRSTRNSTPIWWGIENDEIKLTSTNTINIQNGFRVRGCRPAPSAYQSVMDLFKKEKAAAPQQRAKKASAVFNEGPLGGLLTVSSEKKKIFADYSSFRPMDNNGSLFTNGNKQFYRYDYKNSSFQKTIMPNSGLGVSQYLKKATAVKNDNSRENLVVAVWNRPVGIWQGSDDQKINGTGTVSLVTYKDSVNGYARLDSVTLPESFTMGKYATGEWNLSALAMSSWVYANNIISTYENYISRFQILATDFDQDGTDELVVAVDRKVVVFKKESSGNNYKKLYSREFKTYKGTTYGTKETVYGNVRVAVGDVDGDKIPDIAAVFEAESAKSAPGTAPYLWNVEVYSSGNLNTVASYNKTFSHVNGGAYHYDDRHYETFEDIKIGNVAGHGVNNIVVMAAQFGNAPSVYVFEHDKTATGELEVIATYTNGTTASPNLGDINFNFNVTLVNFDGTGSPSDIVAGLDILKFSEEGKGSLIKKTDTKLSGNNWFVHNDMIVSGNFDGNNQGKEQLSVLHMTNQSENLYTWKRISHDIISVTGNTYVIKSEIEGSGDNVPHCMNADLEINNTRPYGEFTGIKSEYNNIPFIAAVRSAEASKTMEYVGHSSSMTEPRIYALLAAPPFWKYKPDGSEYEYAGATSMGTAWGKTTTSGSGSSRESTNKGSLILGYEYEFGTPIFYQKIGGIDFEMKLEWEATQSTEKQWEETQSIEWTSPQNDAVILSATFYDTYSYKITGSENPDEIGGIVTVSIVDGPPRTMALNLEDYKALTADSPECPDVSTLFTHTVGNPFSYPSSKDQIKSNVPISFFNNGIIDYDRTQPSDVLWAINDGFSEYINVGSGNDCTRSISLDESKMEQTGFNFNLEAQLVTTTVPGFKVGAGYGHGESWATQHTEGKGHAIAGTVPAPSRLGEVPNFQWSVCWFKYKIGNQEFPVVYYVVKE